MTQRFSCSFNGKNESIILGTSGFSPATEEGLLLFNNDKMTKPIEHFFTYHCSGVDVVDVWIE